MDIEIISSIFILLSVKMKTSFLDKPDLFSTNTSGDKKDYLLKAIYFIFNVP